MTTWLETYFQSQKIVYIVIDRTAWECINLFVISVVWQKRAFLIYFELLPKLGSSNFDEQSSILTKALPLFNNYKICILGDREFCSVKLANCLNSKTYTFVYV